MIILQDIITYKNTSCPNELLKQVKIIAEHTKNTWQSNRSLDGKSEQALYIATQIRNGTKFN